MQNLPSCKALTSRSPRCTTERPTQLPQRLWTLCRMFDISVPTFGQRCTRFIPWPVFHSR